ncbi:MAG TPA: HNH endonuclease signature motif containing protein, partial [Chloroflexota bacterium]|nr:HNH endonuclease signature motif containing protein [Chloroflexota bacterium]
MGLSRRQAPEDRFWAKVDQNGPIPAHCPELGQCWLWTGAKQGSGHGSFRVGKLTQAHRFSWELTHGEIPDGLVVCHLCDVPACVRVEHLTLGTMAWNNGDKAAKGRAPRIGGDRHHARLHPE